MPSTPPPFDDGGELPDAEPRRTSAEAVRGPAGPNYFVRRIIAVIGAVVVIGAGAIVVGQVVGDDDGNGGGGGGAVAAEWNTIVLVDERTDELVLLADDGDEIDRLNTGVRAPVEAEVSDRWLMVRNDERVGIVDLAGGDDAVVDAEFDEGTAPLARPSGSANTLLASGIDADRLLLLHGPSGDVLDTEESADVTGARYDVALTRTDPSGRNVLVSDIGNFQSVLLSFDRDDPTFFPGLPLAVDDDAVVTTQNVGADATISVFDHDGEPVTSARTSAVRAAMLVDGGVVLISVTGEIMTLQFGDDEADVGGTMSIGTITDGNVSVNGDRLIVDGDDGVGLVDDEATIVEQLAGAARTTFGIDADAPHRSTCVLIDRSPPGEIVAVDLLSGDIAAEALGSTPAFASAAGCTAVVTTDGGDELISSAGVTELAVGGEVVALSPDGADVVIEVGTRLELADVNGGEVTEGGVDANDDSDDEDEAGTAEPIDLGRAGRFVRFAQR